jgi:hypothetical protein
MEDFDLYHAQKLDYLGDLAHQKAKELGRSGHSEGYSHQDCPECAHSRSGMYANLSPKQFGGTT